MMSWMVFAAGIPLASIVVLAVIALAVIMGIYFSIRNKMRATQELKDSMSEEEYAAHVAEGKALGRKKGIRRMAIGGFGMALGVGMTMSSQGAAGAGEEYTVFFGVILLGGCAFLAGLINLLTGSQW